MKFQIYQEMHDKRYWWAASFDRSTENLPSTTCRDEMRMNNEMLRWCQQEFGSTGRFDDGVPRWNNDISWGEVSFSDKKDLEWFLLRWA